MTKLLEKAFEAASALPEEAQDQLAAQLLQELADEAKWHTAFAGSAEKLAELAAEALEEYRAGRTEELGFDEV
jgi:hypothetical protein